MPFNIQGDEFKTIYTFAEHNGKLVAEDTSNTGNNFLVEPSILLINERKFQGLYQGGDESFIGIWRY